MSASKQVVSLLVEADKLHREVEHKREKIMCEATESVITAWHAGRQLREAKVLLRSDRGHGHWEDYAKKFFSGSLVTATRYMRLAKTFSALKDLPPMSLDQIYRMWQAESASKKSKPIGTPCGHIFHARKVITHIRETLDVRQGYLEKKLRTELCPLRMEMDRLYSESSESII